MVRKLAFILLFLAGHAMAETAAFDPKTNVLTIPSLRVGTRLFSTTQVALPADGKWAIVGVESERAALPSDLAVTPTSITGKTGETIKFNISGGTPPYVVSSSDYYVAAVGSTYGINMTYYSTAPAGVTPQAAATVIIGDKGTAQVWVTDAAGDVSTLSVISTGVVTVAEEAACQASVMVAYTTYGGETFYRPELRPTILSVSPTIITANINEALTLSIGGGTPPYNITSSRSAIASVSPIAQSANRCQTSAIVSTHAAGTVQLTAMDGGGALATVMITVTVNDVPITPFAISPAAITARAGESIKVSIVGGRPPYQVSSSNNFVAYPDKGTYETTAPRAEATLRTRSPGTATITVSEADGNQAIVTVTVTR